MPKIPKYRFSEKSIFFREVFKNPSNMLWRLGKHRKWNIRTYTAMRTAFSKKEYFLKSKIPCWFWPSTAAMHTGSTVNWGIGSALLGHNSAGWRKNSGRYGTYAAYPAQYVIVPGLRHPSPVYGIYFPLISPIRKSAMLSSFLTLFFIYINVRDSLNPMVSYGWVNTKVTNRLRRKAHVTPNVF